jgi:hypothetical protein
MASEVDICNLALARLGDKATVATIDPPEGSAQAEHCARFYPIARDSLLEAHAWKFATRRAMLAQLVHETWNWGFAYAAPTGAIRLLSVLPAAARSDADTVDFEAETDAAGNALIFTNLDHASVRYIARVTDTTKYSPMFVDALAMLLASHLAGPVVKGDAGVKMSRACYQSFRLLYSQAIESDANQHQVTPSHNPDWIAARGGLPTAQAWDR